MRSSVRPLPQANQPAPLHARNSAYQQFPLLLAAVLVGAGSFWPVLSMLRLLHLSLACAPGGYPAMSSNNASMAFANVRKSSNPLWVMSNTMRQSTAW